ncbi:MAG TPA: glycoside hydrolase family 97 protein [Ferruginibacter sp.]|nr:glycoside hydrolase family 97 protein [Ferruginibacter sp.]HMP20020.1 glycoside hydrolase family 97 protein [Ferruginibacter sp.]
MKLLYCFIVLSVANTSLFATDSLLVSSPDKKITVTVFVNNSISYTVKYEGNIILQPSSIDLVLQNKPSLSHKIKLQSYTVKTFDNNIISPVPEKRKIIRDNYNELKLNLQQPYALLFRVYNDGVAYRIATSFKDSIVIQNEKAVFTFQKQQKILLPLIDPGQRTDKFHTSFEELYQLKTIDSLSIASFAYTPVLIGAANEIKVAVTESDLEDYPGMFLQGTGSNAIEALFAPYPLATAITDGEFPQEVVTKRASYIAKTKGTRNFPWRVLIVAKEDKELPGCDLLYRLASPSKIQDASWINPGKGTDEWIIGINLFNVPFKAGINTATYKYYIDFAKQFGLQRIMMDAGWSNYQNLFDIHPHISMDTIAAYAKANGIKLSLWTLCSTLDKQLDSALAQFNTWGVDFIMTDFMDRDDQVMVNFYDRISKACADKKIMIMFHGAYPMKGYNRTWPNNVTREGVLGSEYNIWSDKPTPSHNVTLPFTRMLAGPMDYEPGILDNATKEQFRPISKKVMSQGTRCHQLAMFVVYDSPVQIFSGNPSQAMMEPAFMKFLGEIPTTWDETMILEGKVGEYIVTARRKGTDWWIGGMAGQAEKEVDYLIDFITGEYEATACIDGINAADYPSDYQLNTYSMYFGSDNLIKLKMAAGGGFVIKLKKKK